MKVLYERVAGIDVHKDMIKVAIRSPGDKPWTRKTEILEFRTFYGVLQEMARLLRRRGVTHVVMEASGVYTEPVYYALREQDFEEVAVINPAHAKALKGHKTDARDCARLAELFECGLLHGSYIPAPELKEVRDLTRYRMKTVQARTSEIQRLEVLIYQYTEAAIRAERRYERVDDDQQRDHRDEHVQRDHQGQVLTFDLVEPPVHLQPERHPRTPLKPFLIGPQLFPVTSHPRGPGRPPSAATRSRFARSRLTHRRLTHRRHLPPRNRAVFGPMERRPAGRMAGISGVRTCWARSPR